MGCPRCQGLMVADECVDSESLAEISIVAWRCLSCGERLDPVILKNRSVPPVLIRSRARGQTNSYGLEVPRLKMSQSRL